MTTPHSAGYNHYEVAEYLLERGAEVNATDKGGLIPLHNASSYGVCNQYHYRVVFTPLPWWWHTTAYRDSAAVDQTWQQDQYHGPVEVYATP